jgi:hypothetical protein
MIFAKNFFQTIVQDEEGRGLPGVYVPASEEINQNTSEIVYADLDKKRLVRPASLRFRLQDPSCTGLGNLIEAKGGMPAQQVFICGQSLIQIPITIRR